MRARVGWIACAVWVGASLVLSPEAAGNGPGLAPGVPESGDDDQETPPARWRFRDADKPVKVVVVAGSIGAFPRWSYADRLEAWCSSVEVENLSKSGLGAWALKQRFREQVLKNRRLASSVPGELWLLFGGGLNSVGMPERTNRWVRDLFVLAHRAGLGVVALTVTPWGDEKDRRWRGASGLHYWKSTRKVVDFILGRLSPHEALGREVRRRPEPEAPWQPEELPDVAIDLYDSDLRQRAAKPRDLAAMVSALSSDPRWQGDHRNLDPDRRANALQDDARRATQIPRWYLRPELRGFDHIHPNREGHLLMAQLMCPSLPESWGCRCPGARSVP